MQQARVCLPCTCIRHLCCIIASQHVITCPHLAHGSCIDPPDDHSGLEHSRSFWHCLQVQEGQHCLLVTLHHTVTDGWSTSIICKELSAAYSSFALHNHPPSLPPLPVQYAGEHPSPLSLANSSHPCSVLLVLQKAQKIREGPLSLGSTQHDICGGSALSFHMAGCMLATTKYMKQHQASLKDAAHVACRLCQLAAQVAEGGQDAGAAGLLAQQTGWSTASVDLSM